jgi:glycosyltransferase involved in cell wall biosynthesis
MTKYNSCLVNEIKPVVLIFMGHYLPGYKAGGILRNIVNTVDNLCHEFDFRIVTNDRDLGDKRHYPDIKVNDWVRVENAQVYYISPESASLQSLSGLVQATHHDILFLTSFFDLLTVKILLSRKFCPTRFKPIIVAPFGEFAWASLGQKYPKKFIFIQLAKLFGLYDDIIWRVSSEYEVRDVAKVMEVRRDAFHITGDLPIKHVPVMSLESESETTSDFGVLRIVFLSRIAREKNLDFALKILATVQSAVLFDIYGPAENTAYWNECQVLIAALPSHVKVNYLGNVHPQQVLQIFGRYDLFLFPTGGEAYGNVIAESLTAGTPVLVSTETPWRNLQRDGLGWDISLDSMNDFVNVIENYARLTHQQRLERRSIVRIRCKARLFDPEVLESNRQLFLMQLEK